MVSAREKWGEAPSVFRPSNCPSRDWLGHTDLRELRLMPATHYITAYSTAVGPAFTLVLSFMVFLLP